MNINSGVLLAFDVQYDEPRLDLPFGRIDKSRTWQEEGDLLLSEPSGHLVANYMIEHVIVGLPQLFGEPAKSAFIMVGEKEPYCTRLAAFPLSEQQLANLIELGGDSLAEVNSFVRTFLPKFEGDRVWPRTEWQLFGRILLLNSIEGIPSADESPPEAVSNLLRLLRQTQTAAAPFTFFDLLVFPSPWPGDTDEFTALLTRNGGVIENGRKLTLPLSAFALIEYVSYTAIIRHLGSRIRQLPLGESSLSEYLTHTGLKPGRALSVYSEVHLRDREMTFQQLHETQRALSELRSRLQSNYVEIARRGSLSRSFPAALSHPLRFSLFNRLVGNLDKAVATYDGARQVVESREQATRDYLRDLLIAETTESNLEIQRRIRLLTTVAVILGILGLVSNFLPDTVKEAIYNYIVGG